MVATHTDRHAAPTAGGGAAAWRLGHRPALDGLRGAAVLLVIGAHLEVPGMAGGGTVGVTLFFALSGFLITSLLLQEATDRGRVQLPAFYARRALRLVPALVALVAVASVADAVLLPGTPLARNAAYALGYLANVARAQGTGLGSLGHTWSLAMEEQFYLLWPLVLVACGRRRQLALGIAAGGAALVAVHRTLLWLGGATEARVYFGPDTRGDAILLGCALALIVARGWQPPAWAGRAATVALAACTGLFVGAGSTYTWGLTATAAASVLLVAHTVQHPHRLLSTPWLRRAGQLSYGLYLWHVPINWTVQARLADQPALARAVVVAGLTWAATMASYRLVERPFLALKHHVAA